jgi:hypothetical protein
MMAMANQPIEQYGQLATTEQLGPAQMQTQQALANQAALQGARAQMDIQSRVDPQAYAQRQMRMNAANERLGKLYGVANPNAISYQGGSQAYQIPGSENQPDLSKLRQIANAVASNVSTAGVNKEGANPVLKGPTKSLPVTAGTFPSQPYSYL